MKRSLRLPFSFLLLLTVLSVLSLRVALRRGPELELVSVAAPLQPINETLVKLASVDLAEASMRTDVEQLLEGNFPLSYSRSRGGAAARLRSYSVWRRENHIEGRTRIAARYPARLRTPKDFRMFPELRRALRDWFRVRRFQPEIMSELVGMLKRPIDIHFGHSGDVGKRYRSCAIVGNSGILLKHDNGKLIDSHDVVIRLNNARIEGYRHKVGSKTNISFVNSNILHSCARRETCYCHPYGEDVPIVMYICQAVHFIDYTTCNSSHKAPLLITDPRFDMLCARIVKYYSLKRFVEETGKPVEEWAKIHDEKMFHYSSGMQAVMLGLGICDQVSVFGFGKSTEAKHHYHTNQKAELSLHDYESEYQLYGDLADRPQVIPFLRDSGFKVPPVVFYH